MSEGGDQDVWDDEGDESESDKKRQAVPIGQPHAKPPPKKRPKRGQGGTIFQSRWDQMFNRLLEYKKKKGDCLVPNRYSEDPQLGSWVSVQRQQYKLLTSGGSASTPLTLERATKLMEIGFQWSTKDPRLVPWSHRVNELKAFVEKYGHAQVPYGWKENVQLATWVCTQRQEYKLHTSGRASRLSDERIQELDEVGFTWKVEKGCRKKLVPLRTPPPDPAIAPVAPTAAPAAAVTSTNIDPALATHLLQLIGQHAAAPAQVPAPAPVLVSAPAHNPAPTQAAIPTSDMSGAFAQQLLQAVMAGAANSAPLAASLPANNPATNVQEDFITSVLQRVLPYATMAHQAQVQPQQAPQPNISNNHVAHVQPQAQPQHAPAAALAPVSAQATSQAQAQALLQYVGANMGSFFGSLAAQPSQGTAQAHTHFGGGNNANAGGGSVQAPPPTAQGQHLGQIIGGGGTASPAATAPNAPGFSFVGNNFMLATPQGLVPINAQQLAAFNLGFPNQNQQGVPALAIAIPQSAASNPSVGFQVGAPPAASGFQPAAYQPQLQMSTQFLFPQQQAGPSYSGPTPTSGIQSAAAAFPQPQQAPPWLQFGAPQHQAAASMQLGLQHQGGAVYPGAPPTSGIQPPPPPPAAASLPPQQQPPTSSETAQQAALNAFAALARLFPATAAPATAAPVPPLTTPSQRIIPSASRPPVSYVTTTTSGQQHPFTTTSAGGSVQIPAPAPQAGLLPPSLYASIQEHYISRNQAQQSSSDNSGDSGLVESDTSG